MIMELTLYQLYQKLLTNMGLVGQWPHENKTEIVVGAILVQNTNWSNVDKALNNLRPITHFDPAQLLQINTPDLQELIRPAGFYRNKEKALRTILTWLQEFDFNYEAITKHYGTDLRKHLLSLRGIGQETADVLLTFVFDQARFISDNYARRLMTHLGIPNLTNYQSLAKQCYLDSHFSVKDAQDFHGLILEFGKRYFRGHDTFSDSFLAHDKIVLAN